MHYFEATVEALFSVAGTIARKLDCAHFIESSIVMLTVFHQSIGIDMPRQPVLVAAKAGNMEGRK